MLFIFLFLFIFFFNQRSWDLDERWQVTQATVVIFQNFLDWHSPLFCIFTLFNITVSAALSLTGPYNHLLVVAGKALFLCLSVFKSGGPKGGWHCYFQSSTSPSGGTLYSCLERSTLLRWIFASGEKLRTTELIAPNRLMFSFPKTPNFWDLSLISIAQPMQSS